MTSPADFMLKELMAMRAGYAARLPAKISRIEEAGQSLLKAGGGLEPLKDLHHLTHSMAGTSGTYGYAELSASARRLEIYLKKIIQGGNHEISSEQSIEISAMLADLSAASLIEDQAKDLLPEDVSPSPSPVSPPSPQSQPDIKFSSDVEAFLVAKPVERLIYLVDNDAVLVDKLALQLSYYGYIVRTFFHPQDVVAAVDQAIPAAIIMDLVFPGGVDGAKIAIDLNQERLEPIPIFMISTQTDLNSRLRAVRAGAKAFFTKPVSISAIVDKLDSLTVHQLPEPYRVLIIEDEADLAALYARTLEETNIRTFSLTNPLEELHYLKDFAPDLILMDLNMPGCTGIELASVIRQQEGYISIPIVFLSAERDLDKHLQVMQLGGDDFLTKPVNLAYLISSVTSRAERSRALRALMERDSLTGLLNHTTTKEQLELEINRAHRNNHPLAYAMIDIDHFKRINDSFGHAMGDQVIKSMARLLRQRLRKTDIIGRYGGEEFAVMLPGADTRTGFRVLEELRNGFNQIRHQSHGVDFAVTFSCGMALFPEFNDASSLNDAADKALYEAKRAGRNRIMIAHS
ncbi:MAG TPA: diguanylate cyclase [Chloroflexia bacterium]|nr:diguanylate cyclase [Chloroflexia bacterium]